MVNKYKPELTNLQQGIFNLLFANPTKDFNMLRLSQILEVSQPAVKKSLPLLEKKKFVRIYQDKESKRYSVTLNRDNEKIFNMKRAKNLELIYSSDLVSYIFNLFPGCTIILFGSYSKGEDTENSDIDLAIIGSSEKKINVSKFEKFLEREIIFNFYKSFGAIKDNNLKNNLLNGIILSGSIEL